ncbi:MAG: 5-formyltetrahydrofolate cyclo-ligase [Pseudomonadota bacterium]
MLLDECGNSVIRTVFQPQAEAEILSPRRQRMRMQTCERALKPPTISLDKCLARRRENRILGMFSPPRRRRQTPQQCEAGDGMHDPAFRYHVFRLAQGFPATMNDQPADNAAFRAALRREKIAARQALPDAERRRLDARVRAHLAGFLRGRPAGSFAFCWPIRGEVDCRPLAVQLLAAGWRAAMPVATAAARPLTFRAWTPDAPMATDAHGVPVPATVDCPCPEVLLIPLVAFDAAGYRLGYGGGYFDRTLAAQEPRPLAVGVGFDLCATASIRPGRHDIPLNAIATESGMRSVDAP